MKPLLEKPKLLLLTAVLVKAARPAWSRVLNETETVVGQIGVAKSGAQRNVFERCGHSANSEPVTLDEVEELKESAVDEVVRNMLKASLRVTLHDVQIPSNATHGEVLLGAWW